MTTRKFLFLMVSSRGVPSSKRIITIFAFLLMATGFITNLFFNLTIDEFIFDSMKWIVIGGLGFTASEQFARGGTRITTSMGKNAPRINTRDDDYSDYNDHGGYNHPYGSPYGSREQPTNNGYPEYVEGADEVNDEINEQPPTTKKKRPKKPLD